MATEWTDWLAAPDLHRKIDTLVVIGVGGPDTLDALLEVRARRIALVNANPTQREALQQAAAHDPRLSLTPVAVAADDGDAVFHALSLPSLSGLCAPQDLMQLFPGLRQLEKTRVPTLTLEQALRRVVLPAEGCHVLRIEAPANSAALARQVLDLPEDLVIEHIFLRTAQPGLYSGDADPAPLLEALETQGYRCEERLTSDPDFPEVWLRRDSARMQIRRSEAECAKLRQALEVAQTEAGRIPDIEASLEHYRSVAARVPDLERRLQEVAEQHRRCAGRTKELEQALDDARSKIRHAEEALGAMTETHKEERASTKAAQDRIKTLESQVAEAEAQRDAQRQQAVEMAETQENLRRETEDIQAKAREETVMAIRLQTLTQEDLRELRRHYQELLAEKRTQDSLLRSVTARLQQAAQYLQQLNPGEANFGAEDALETAELPGAGEVSAVKTTGETSPKDATKTKRRAGATPNPGANTSSKTAPRSTPRSRKKR